MSDQPIYKDEASRVLDDAFQELRRARSMHKQMNSAHEAYSVILEELDEFWDEVKKKRTHRSDLRMASELIQIAAMAMRARIDLGLISLHGGSKG